LAAAAAAAAAGSPFVKEDVEADLTVAVAGLDVATLAPCSSSFNFSGQACFDGDAIPLTLERWGECGTEPFGRTETAVTGEVVGGVFAGWFGSMRVGAAAADVAE